jgi:hypothetical protein
MPGKFQILKMSSGAGMVEDSVEISARVDVIATVSAVRAAGIKKEPATGVGTVLRVIGIAQTLDEEVSAEVDGRGADTPGLMPVAAHACGLNLGQ